MGRAVGRSWGRPGRVDKGAPDLLGAVPKAFVFDREVGIRDVFGGKRVRAFEEVSGEDVVEGGSVFL